jgi:hypothetical protein
LDSYFSILLILSENGLSMPLSFLLEDSKLAYTVYKKTDKLKNFLGDFRSRLLCNSCYFGSAKSILPSGNIYRIRASPFVTVG